MKGQVAFERYSYRKGYHGSLARRAIGLAPVSPPCFRTVMVTCDNSSELKLRSGSAFPATIRGTHRAWYPPGRKHTVTERSAAGLLGSKAPRGAPSPAAEIATSN